MRCCDAAAGEYIFHQLLPQMVSLLLRKEARGGGIAAISYCFVPFRHDQRAEPVWRLCDRPLETFAPLTFELVAHPTSAGRGGSVSRRDHNQAYRRQKALSGGTNYEGATTSNASYSSGEGVWGRGASLREAASPPDLPPKRLSGREREGGGLSTERPPPSHTLLPPRICFGRTVARRRTLFVERWEAANVDFFRGVDTTYSR